ncbi:hypothetical protein [Campylobacter sp. MG1]|uniref:hypothetical protein n=1 Tax=Campylobacter sp. MG1 TaxID=2976332 RepID=UPI00226D2DF8|nr:hypothetical protein [Campylobacter sp. MG1]
MKILLWTILILVVILGLIYIFGYWDKFIENLMFVVFCIPLAFYYGFGYLMDSRCKECKKFL